MQDLRNLFNQALTTVGAAPSVTDPNANTRETLLCQLWYAPARRAVLTAFHWSSARATARLSRLAKLGDAVEWQAGMPDPGFQFTHALPINCLQPQNLATLARFKLGRLNDSAVIFSNTSHPILHYTYDETDSTKFSSDLYSAVVASLAASLNMAKNGKMQLTQALEKKVLHMISDAMVAEANSDDTYLESIPTHWANTGFTVPNNSVQYYYPTSTFRVAGIAV